MRPWPISKQGVILLKDKGNSTTLDLLLALDR